MARDALLKVIEQELQGPAGGASDPDPVAIVEKWFLDSFPNTVVSRDVEIWAVVFHAAEDLKKRLRPPDLNLE